MHHPCKPASPPVSSPDTTRQPVSPTRNIRAHFQLLPAGCLSHLPSEFCKVLSGSVSILRPRPLSQGSAHRLLPGHLPSRRPPRQPHRNAALHFLLRTRSPSRTPTVSGPELRLPPLSTRIFLHVYGLMSPSGCGRTLSHRHTSVCVFYNVSAPLSFTFDSPSSLYPQDPSAGEPPMTLSHLRSHTGTPGTCQAPDTLKSALPGKCLLPVIARSNSSLVSAQVFQPPCRR